MSDKSTGVQGMYALLDDKGMKQCTVTMPHVSLTTYRKASLFVFDTDVLERKFAKIAHAAGTQIDQKRFEQDFTDLLQVVGKVDVAEMHLLSGNKLTTYTIGEPVADEKSGLLELCPYREEWWYHPNVQPIVESIKEYLPEFAPWKMQLDPYIRILSGRSNLV